MRRPAQRQPAIDRQPNRPVCGSLVVLLLLAMVLGQVGCVRRRLTVRSWPPGAQVFIDDQEVGTTPCSTSFIYYGTRKITVIKNGYNTETLYHEISPPYYQYPPLDFITENLLPNEIRDERVVDIQLSPEQLVPQNVLLDRAQGLRDSARAGYVVPTSPGAGLPGSASPSKQPAFSLPGQGLPGGEPQIYQPLPSTSPSPPPGGVLTQPGVSYSPEALPPATSSGTSLLPLPPVSLPGIP